MDRAVDVSTELSRLLDPCLGSLWAQLQAYNREHLAFKSQSGRTFCFCSEAQESCHQLVTRSVLVELHVMAGGYQHAIAIPHALVNILPEQSSPMEMRARVGLYNDCQYC